MMTLHMYVLVLCAAVVPPAPIQLPTLVTAPTLVQAPIPVPPQPPVPTQPLAPPVADKPPSLDEALGLGDAGKQSDTTTDASELQRSLDGAKPRDILNSAIDDMKHSAQLLEASDSGISTRRVQESVVRKLDELIATAQRMKQQQSQQGQESQGQQSQGQSGKRKDQGAKDGKDGKDGQDGKRPEPGENGQPRGGRDGKQDQDGANGKRRKDGDATSNEPPEQADPTMTDAQFDEGRAEWGRLPPRVREAVRQGLRDPMSAAYRQLTQDYYRRLAEEPKR